MAIDPSKSILDVLQAQLTPETIQKMSAQLGTDTAATSHAVSMAIPILLGRLSKNASDASGSAALDSALNAHDGGLLDNLGGLLGSGSIGGKILGHILGSRRAPVEQGVGRASGLNVQQVAQLLTMLAPLVMAVLGRMKREQNVGATELPEVLGQANLAMTRQSTAVGDLSRLLDKDDDSTLADEVARIGSSIPGGLLSPGPAA